MKKPGKRSFARNVIATIREAAVPGINAHQKSTWPNQFDEYGDNEIGHYFNADGSPCCILGAGLAANGVTYEMVGDDEDGVNGQSVDSLFSHLAQMWHYKVEEMLTPEETTWLNMAQKCNDDGHDWDKAVYAADAVVFDKHGRVGLASVRDVVNRPEKPRVKKPRVEVVTTQQEVKTPTYQEAR